MSDTTKGLFPRGKLTVISGRTNVGKSMTGDSYNRIKVSDNEYQCGCKWERREGWGDVLVQCALHQSATNSNHAKFDRERNNG